MRAPNLSWELPKISIEFHIVEKGKPDIRYTYEGEMPEAIKDRFQQLVGDGLARVSVGVPMDLKDYGNGAGAHVSIGLTCNQDENTIHSAACLAMDAVLYYVKEDLHKAIVEFDQIVAQRRAQLAGNNSSPQYG